MLAVVAVLGGGRAAADPDEITLDTIRTRSSTPDPDLRVACPTRATWPTPSKPPAKARFTVAADGTISVAADAPPNTIAFTNTTKAIAVLERPGAAPLACDWVHDQIYELPVGAKPEILQLRVFDTVDEAAKQRVRAYRRDKVAALQKRELAALHATPELRAFVTAARTAVLTPTGEAIDHFDAAAHKLDAELAQVRAEFACDADVPNGPLAPAVCADAFSLDHAAASIWQAVVGVRGKDAADQLRELRAAKVADAISALGAEQLPVVVDEQAHCDALDELSWLSVEDMPRLVNRSQLPIVDVVYGATYGVKRDPVKDLVPGDRSFAFVVSSVPVTEKTAFRERQGDRTSLEPIAIAAAFFKATLATSWPPTASIAGLKQSQRQWKAKVDAIEEQVARAQASRAHFEGLKSLSNDDKKAMFLLDAEVTKLAREKTAASNELARVSADLHDVVEEQRIDAAPVADPSLICHRPDHDAHGELHRFRIDTALPPTTGIENLAHVIEELKTDHQLSVVLCNGTCTAAADEKTDRAQVAITPSTRWSFTLLAELAGGFAHHGGVAGLSQPELVPVLGADGPDQVFELAQTPDPRNVFSTSLLLAYRLPYRFVVGLGPTLLVGTSGAVFQQWNARVGFKLGRGVYATVGPSLRAMQFANDYELGDRISVPRPAGGSASAPTLAKHYEAVLEWQLGFSFDLAEVGGLGSDIYKALGGK